MGEGRFCIAGLLSSAIKPLASLRCLGSRCFEPRLRIVPAAVRPLVGVSRIVMLRLGRAKILIDQLALQLSLCVAKLVLKGIPLASRPPQSLACVVGLRLKLSHQKFKFANLVFGFLKIALRGARGPMLLVEKP